VITNLRTSSSCPGLVRSLYRNTRHCTKIILNLGVNFRHNLFFIYLYSLFNTGASDRCLALNHFQAPILLLVTYILFGGVYYVPLIAQLIHSFHLMTHEFTALHNFIQIHLKDFIISCRSFSYNVINFFVPQNTALVKIMLTLMGCGIFYSPRSVCPSFKQYCCSLVFVCWTWRRTGSDRTVNHFAHMMNVFWINGFYSLRANITLTNSVCHKLAKTKHD
jgi:hypothetical protein